MSGGGKGGGEKTEAPTPKKKREARRNGQIPRSPDVVAWAQMLGASFLLQWTASIGSGRLTSLLDHMQVAIARPDTAVALRLLGSGAMAGLITLAPLVLGMLVIGVIGHIAQVGLVFSGKALKPKWERVSPAKGLKRMLSPASIWEAVKSLLKVAVLTFVAWGPLTDLAGVLAGASRPPAGEVLGVVGVTVLSLVRTTALAGLLLAAADYAYQRRRIRKMVMMSRQEVKEEFRHSEGDPHVRAQIRRRQMEMSRNRMMSDVASSTVVLVNPTHYAVALRYEAGSGAPRVVAKGKGFVAQRIRQEAERNRVPVVTDVPLARGLHAACKVGQEIPAELYEAVARVLAFVFSLKKKGVLAGA